MAGLLSGSGSGSFGGTLPNVFLKEPFSKAEEPETVLEKPQLVARDFSETAPAPLFPLKKVLKMAPPSKLFCGAPPEKL